MRSGWSRSGIVVPSARNSGFDKMSKRTPIVKLVAERYIQSLPYIPGLPVFSNTSRIVSAVRHGTVLFSTTILSFSASAAIIRVADSKYDKFGALPAPVPAVLVGVLTQTNTMSALLMAPLTSVEKKRFCRREFPSRASLSTSGSPGSYKGSFSLFHADIAG